jgi:hypothetical protein
MDTEKRDRWLIMWQKHNRDGKDPVWSLQYAAYTMGGKITEAEAEELIGAASRAKYLSADQLAQYLGVTLQQRTLLDLRTIGACDFSKRQRKKQRRHRNRMYLERRRRVAGAIPECLVRVNLVVVINPS